MGNEGRLGGWNVHNNTTTNMFTQAGRRILMIISPFAGPPFKRTCTRMLSLTGMLMSVLAVYAVQPHIPAGPATVSPLLRGSQPHYKGGGGPVRDAP